MWQLRSRSDTPFFLTWSSMISLKTSTLVETPIPRIFAWSMILDATSESQKHVAGSTIQAARSPITVKQSRIFDFRLKRAEKLVRFAHNSSNC